jgi:hypothetical protein
MHLRRVILNLLSTDDEYDRQQFNIAIYFITRAGSLTPVFIFMEPLRTMRSRRYMTVFRSSKMRSRAEGRRKANIGNLSAGSLRC